MLLLIIYHSHWKPFHNFIPNFHINLVGKDKGNANSLCGSSCWNYIENAPYNHQTQFTATSSPVNSQRHSRSKFSTMESAITGNAVNILYASLIGQGRFAVCGITVGCKPTGRSFMSRRSYTWPGASVANLSCFYMLLEFAESLKSQTIQKVDRPSKKNEMEKWIK